MHGKAEDFEKRQSELAADIAKRLNNLEDSLKKATYENLQLRKMFWLAVRELGGEFRIPFKEILDFDDDRDLQYEKDDKSLAYIYRVKTE